METVREKKIVDIEEWDSFFSERIENLEPYNHYDDGYADALDQIDDWLYAQPNFQDADKWVSVKKPPKENGIYQVFMYDYRWHIWKAWYGQFVFPYGWFVNDIQGDHITCTVTHWMPLPKPPKEVQ